MDESGVGKNEYPCFVESSMALVGAIGMSTKEIVGFFNDLGGDFSSLLFHNSSLYGIIHAIIKQIDGGKMKTSHRIKELRGIDPLQDKVVEEVLEAYYFLRRPDETETINATLQIISEYKDMTSVYCANCTKTNYCDDCFPMKKREIFVKIENMLLDQLKEITES